MKTFFIIITLLTLMNGCSSQNAFSSFNITLEQAKSEDSILSSKIENNGKVNGIVSAVYLNSILPKQYHGNEYFYVYLYTKDKTEVNFFLNNSEALEVEQLPADNKFTYLTSSSPSWQEYYLVHFKKQGKSLSFKVQNSPYSSQKMLFKKEY